MSAKDVQIAELRQLISELQLCVDLLTARVDVNEATDEAQTTQLTELRGDVRSLKMKLRRWRE